MKKLIFLFLLIPFLALSQGYTENETGRYKKKFQTQKLDSISCSLLYAFINSTYNSADSIFVFQGNSYDTAVQDTVFFFSAGSSGALIPRMYIFEFKPDYRKIYFLTKKGSPLSILYR